MITTTRETAIGPAYIRGKVTLVFRYGGLLSPQVLIGDALIEVKWPNRFGRWGTHSERLAYIKRFEAGEALWEVKSCD